jgi:hypothetical protein
MIKLTELNPKGFALSDEQAKNLEVLCDRLNVVRKAWGKPMYITSGFRSEADHRRIYKEKAAREGKSVVRVPMGSQHLKGAAADIFDANGALTRWLKANPDILEKAELWCEDDPATPRVHFQIFPPKSGKRWFKP